MDFGGARSNRERKSTRGECGLLGRRLRNLAFETERSLTLRSPVRRYNVTAWTFGAQAHVKRAHKAPGPRAYMTIRVWEEGRGFLGLTPQEHGQISCFCRLGRLEADNHSAIVSPAFLASLFGTAGFDWRNIRPCSVAVTSASG